jgi:hypothetical protein
MQDTPISRDGCDGLPSNGCAAAPLPLLGALSAPAVRVGLPSIPVGPDALRPPEVAPEGHSDSCDTRLHQSTPTPHSRKKRSPGPRRSASNPADTDPPMRCSPSSRTSDYVERSPQKPRDTRRTPARRQGPQHNHRLDIQRNVTVSRHSALLIHPSEVGHPCPVDEEIRLSSLKLTPPPPGSLE